MTIAKELAAVGIKAPKGTIGEVDVDCPKEFCAKARKGTDDHTPLHLIISESHASWKCHHCLWTGNVGTPGEPVKPVVIEHPETEAPPTHLRADCPIVLAQSNEALAMLRECGQQNAIWIENEKALRSLADTITKCSKFIIAFDNTEEGERLRAVLARRIGVAKCWNVSYADTTLEATLKARGADWVCDDINLAKPYPIKGLYHVADFQQSLLEYFEGGMAAGKSTGWQNVDRYYTVMPCEMTVVTGVPNNGKSEWLDALTVNLAIMEEWRFAIFSPENGKEGHVLKLIEKRVEMTANPKSDERMSVETLMAGAEWVGEHYTFIVGDDEDDLPTLDWIMEKAADAILRYGVRALIIDPWNEIEHVRKGTQSETEYVSDALSKLKRFARNHGIHLFVVAHPNKMQTGKDGKIAVPSLYDISGSAHWANKTDNGIVVHRSDDIADATEIWVKKVRFKHVGKRGMTTLKYNKITGRYSIPEGSDNAKYSAVADDEIETHEA